MKRAFVAALGAAIVTGLAVASISGGATARVSLDDGSARGLSLAGAQYKGTFRDAGPGTKIEIKARMKNGEPTAIKKMIYQGLPANCPETGFSEISGGWTLAGVTVNDRRKFKAVGGDNDPVHPSTLRFTGKFNRSFKKVRGKFQTRAYFPATGPPDNLPEETCVSETKRYAAR